jgi:hypothetical protein
MKITRCDLNFHDYRIAGQDGVFKFRVQDQEGDKPAVVHTDHITCTIDGRDARVVEAPWMCSKCHTNNRAANASCANKPSCQEMVR